MPQQGDRVTDARKLFGSQRDGGFRAPPWFTSAREAPTLWRPRDTLEGSSRTVRPGAGLRLASLAAPGNELGEASKTELPGVHQARVPSTAALTSLSP